MTQHARIGNYTAHPSFRDFLVSTRSKVCALFLCYQKTGDIDFVGPSDKPDMVSYLPGNRVAKVVSGGIDPFSDEAGRARMSVGRLVGRMFSQDALADFSVGPKDIESFVNSYKSFFDTTGVRLDVVDGESIRHWYLEDNYLQSQATPLAGTLWKSCMRYESRQRLLDLYVANPDKVKMLVMLQDVQGAAMLRGRALLWQDAATSSSTVRVMDRIYTVHDSDVFKFKSWALENGYICKSEQNSKSWELFDVDGNILLLGVSVTLPFHTPALYPYMDTFQFYDRQSGVFHNNPASPHDYQLNNPEGYLRRPGFDEEEVDMLGEEPTDEDW